MTTSTYHDKKATTDARLTHHLATDARGRTYAYWKCTRCGVEGARRKDLETHDCEAI